MRVIRLGLLGILFAVVTHSALAKLTQTFSPGFASWYATYIVVVETTTIDGDFRVIESWKGDLSPGSRLIIPELIPPPASLPIYRYPTQWTPQDRSGVAERIPRQPAGSRMVLFLKRNTSSERDERKSEWSGSNGRNDGDSLKISAVWIDGGTTYSFTQLWDTSEPIVLSVLGERVKGEGRYVGYSQEGLKEIVVETLRLQEDEEDAAAEQDGRVRTLRLKPYVLSKLGSLRWKNWSKQGQWRWARLVRCLTILRTPKWIGSL